MDILLNIIYGIAGITLLYFGAEFLVKGGVAIAEKMEVPPLVIGLTLVAFGTSAPELVVSVQSALAGNGDISVGNIVGSNICNIALILGLCALITPLKVDSKLIRFDVPLMIFVAVVFSVTYVINDGIGRIMGSVFLAGVILYTCYSVYQAKKDAKGNLELEREIKKEINKDKKKIPLFAAILMVAGGLAGLIFGAKLFLLSAVFVANSLNVSEAIIGLTVVAVGTSLPELSTSVVAAIRKEEDIAIGNVVGSNIFNVLCIMGVSPLLRPIQNENVSRVDFGMMILCSVLLFPIMKSGFVINRLEGAFFLLLYIGYTTYLVLSAGGGI